MAGCCECGAESSGFMKCGNLLTAEEPSASQEGLCSIKLVVHNNIVVVMSYMKYQLKTCMHSKTPAFIYCRFVKWRLISEMFMNEELKIVSEEAVLSLNTGFCWTK